MISSHNCSFIIFFVLKQKPRKIIKQNWERVFLIDKYLHLFLRETLVHLNISSLLLSPLSHSFGECVSFSLTQYALSKNLQTPGKKCVFVQIENCKWSFAKSFISTLYNLLHMKRIWRREESKFKSSLLKIMEKFVFFSQGTQNIFCIERYILICVNQIYRWLRKYFLISINL